MLTSIETILCQQMLDQRFGVRDAGEGGKPMPRQQTVLLVGGTGRTGRRVLQQLLERGITVRTIVRSRGSG